MTEKTNSPAIEIVPYNREQEHALELKRAMMQLVDERVAEITGGPTAIFEPFFQTKRLMTEIRRQQSVAEQNKFAYYYDKWGCMAGCGRTKAEALHSALGMCNECYRRINERLKSIVREHTPPVEQDQTFVEAVIQARTALDPSARVLAITKEQKRRFYTQQQACAKAGIDPKTLYVWLRDGVVRPSIQISEKRWMWTDADVEELKLIKSKNASLHNSKAARARWSKKKALTGEVSQ